MVDTVYHMSGRHAPWLCLISMSFELKVEVESVESTVKVKVECLLCFSSFITSPTLFEKSLHSLLS